MRSSCPPPHQPLTSPTAPPRTGPRGTPSCSGLRCWMKEWKKWEVDEGEGQTGELVMEIRRYFCLMAWKNMGTGMVCFLHRPYNRLELWFSLQCSRLVEGQSPCGTSILLQCSISLTSIVLIKYPRLSSNIATLLENDCRRCLNL